MRIVMIVLGLCAGLGWAWHQGMLPAVGAASADAGIERDGGRVMYQYIDEGGGVQFVDTLDEVPLAQRATAGRIEIDAPRPSVQRSAAAAARVPSDVVVVTTPGCGYCDKTMAWLDDRAIPYTEVDIHSGRPEVEAIGRRHGRVAAPTVSTGDDVIFGWNEGRLEALFDG